MLRRNAFVGWTVAWVWIVSVSTPHFARAERQDARRHYAKATAAFGLGKYLDAAIEYEAAFQIRPEPALLYNAAQAYRLGGNEGRAQQLYRNYLRLFADAQNAEDARQHLADLEASAQLAASTPSPPSPATAVNPGAKPAIPSAPGTLELSSPPPSSPSPSPSPSSMTLAASSTPVGAPGDSSRRLRSRPLFWVAVVAAVAVVVVGTSTLLLSRSGDKDPQASLGMVVGN